MPFQEIHERKQKAVGSGEESPLLFFQKADGGLQDSDLIAADLQWLIFLCARINLTALLELAPAEQSVCSVH